MSTRSFANILLHWYPKYKRELPWRNIKDPYIIWLSEIILQQTRVAQGLPYFERFLASYPTVHHLAAAPVEEVMRLWQGLGYYTRARNLHACARDIVYNRNGTFPRDYKGLLQLKGVGKYTAAAIASFAYSEKVAVVDGNVYRVLGRYFGIAIAMDSTEGRKRFEAIANEAISHAAPDEYNQAIMEFGALQCTPKSPRCEDCPLKAGCFAYRHNMVKELPVKGKKARVSQRTFLYFHITCGEELLVKERGGRDIWQGLVDFPMEELQNAEKITLGLSPLFLELRAFEPSVYFDPEKNYRHILTHQKILSNFVKLDISEDQKHLVREWAAIKGYFPVNEYQLEKLGKPNLIVKYLNDQK